MLAMAARGEAREGDWQIAERQTFGRGRMGRNWISPPGNFYGSTLVCLQPSDPPAATLSFAFAVAVHTVVRSYAPRASIKWPNDILIEGAKVAGLLLERQSFWVIVGIGVNVRTSPSINNRSVTSLAEWVAPPLLEDFQREIVIACDGALARWRGSLAATLADWQSVAHPRGAVLHIKLSDGDQIEGLFDGLTPDCALRLRLADGAVRVIHAGDVFLI